MQKTRAAIGIAIVGLMTTGTSYADSSHPLGWFGKRFGNLSWESAVAATTSPANISWQVKRRLKYSRDQVLAWDDGRQTWERGYGDCKAFAACVADLCDAKGIPCWVAAVRPIDGRDGHAVAIGVWHGKLWMSSNGRYSEHSTLEEVLQSLTRIDTFRGKSLEFVPFSLM